jgi:prepilin-type N-terminal cleavage/methylation domain-containing protein
MVRHRHRKGGFTLIELAGVVMIVGILAGVAVPAIQYAILKADAAHMVADSHTVQLAAYAYLSENGTFPTSGGYGTIPPQLTDYLPDNYSFTYKGAQYMWFGMNYPNTSNSWGTRTLGAFIIRYTQRPDFAEPMYSYWTPGQDTYWSTSYFYYLYYG